MKHFAKRFAGAAVAAGLFISSAASVLPQTMTSLVVYAGDNDFSWSTYSNKDASWWSGSEAAGIADEIVRYQLSDGGWRKDMKTETTGSWNKSTIDNNATWGQIRFLARIYGATQNEKYRNSCLKGIDLLINGQYSNGGWPQVFNDAGTYHAHITFNDTAMVAVLRVLQEIANKSGDFAFIDSTRQSQAKNAVEKGIECILRCQITVNGTLTAWCQQHDEFTLAPAAARAYELPSVCTSESVGIVDFLRSLPDPDERIIRSINAAVTWFDSVKIENTKFDWNSDKSDKVVTTVPGSTIWARFYDLQNLKPLFSDRDGQAYTDVSQISQERRTGYSWYGTWPAKNVAAGIITSGSEPSENKGTHLYVGYADKQVSYNTVQEAVNAAASLNPTSEESRVSIHIAPGTYREQVMVNTPYISFINDDPSKEVKLTWYYGIGYKYYSMGSDGYYNAENAKSKTSKAGPTRWGSAVALKKNADYFRAEYITFENSFNRYVTDEELADGVEVSGAESITFQRYKGADVTSKTATERAAAIAVEGDNSEFYKCNFLGSQDTLFTGGTSSYFRECRIEGNTDYIFGTGTMIFQDCELRFAGYSDKAVGGYITAAKSDGKYLFHNCSVTAASGKYVGSGYFGRPWGAAADVAFVNTKLQYESIITSAGWTSMSGNDPANANYKEFGTTANGAGVNTSGRVSGTVRYSGAGLDVDTYLAGWKPYYYDLTHPVYDPVVIDPIGGDGFEITPDANALPDLWKVTSGLGVGSLIYTDRDMKYIQLPEELIGAYAINTPCDAKKIDRDLAEFTAVDDVKLYVLLDTRVENLPRFLNGWEKLSTEAANDQDVRYYVYVRELSAGESVTFSSNGQSAYCVNYAAAVVKQETVTEPDPVAGDVNSDGEFNISDLVALQNFIVRGTPLADESAADLTADGRINCFDMILMRRLLSKDF